MSGVVGGIVGAVVATHLVESGAASVMGLIVVGATAVGVLVASVGALLIFDWWRSRYDRIDFIHN